MAKRLHAQLFLLILAAAVSSSSVSTSGEFLQTLTEPVCFVAPVAGGRNEVIFDK